MKKSFFPDQAWKIFYPFQSDVSSATDKYSGNLRTSSPIFIPPPLAHIFIIFALFLAASFTSGILMFLRPDLI